MATQRLDIERIAKLEAQMEDLKTDVADVKQDIKELHSRITTGNREIMEKIDTTVATLATADEEQHKLITKTLNEVKERVDVLEKWRFMIVGGAIALGYLMSHLSIFEKFFK
jgi:DNA repair exonuclease SbcCD ATPase subunit